MLSQKVQDAFNKHLNAELYSSYLYLSMSAYFEAENLQGMASWMRIQAGEELGHALKFFDFINERGGRVLLSEVEPPKTEWNGAVDVFQNTYDHECLVSRLINDLVDLTLQEKDHAANAFLQWFVTEQVEEEATAQSVLEKLKLMGDDGMGRFMLDEQLGQRTAAAGGGADAT